MKKRAANFFILVALSGLSLSSFAAEPSSSSKDACKVSVENLVRLLPLNPNAVIVGRHVETNQLIHALQRGKSIVLVGNSGVGRTSIVEGLAQRIHRGDVPESLKDYRIYYFDWRMTSNTQDFVLEKKQTAEGILMERIEAARKDGKKLILHVSELDVLMAPSGDGPMVPEAQRALASRIRSLIAEREILLIGEAKTTIGIEKDPSFRNFETVNVEPLPNSQVNNILAHEIQRLRETYKVEIDESAIEAAIELSRRYFPSAPSPQMPKDLLESAAVIAHQWNQGHPVRVDLLQRQINDLKESLRILNQHPELYPRAIEERQKELVQLTNELEMEIRAIERIRPLQVEIAELKNELEEARISQSSTTSVEERANSLSRIYELEKKIKEKSEQITEIEMELNVKVTATVNSVMVVIAASERLTTPISYRSTDNRELVRETWERMNSLVIGQEEAIRQMVLASSRAFVGLGNTQRQKPLAVLHLVGPTGTGKSESSKLLAEGLFGSKDAAVTFSMSEYQEPHQTARLVGSPAGYVGSDKPAGGSLLAAAVNSRPGGGVLIFDEWHLAHRNVRNSLTEALDTGVLKTGDGEIINLKNWVIIFTSNQGRQYYHENSALEPGHPQYDPSLDPRVPNNRIFNEDRQFTAAGRELVTRAAKAEEESQFNARLTDIIVFNPLPRPVVRQIVDRQIEEIGRREHFSETSNRLEVTEELRQHFVDNSYQIDGGVRVLMENVEQVITSSVQEHIIFNRDVLPGSTFSFFLDEGKIAMEVRPPTGD